MQWCGNIAVAGNREASEGFRGSAEVCCATQELLGFLLCERTARCSHCVEKDGGASESCCWVWVLLPGTRKGVRVMAFGAISWSCVLWKLEEHVPISQALHQPGGCEQQIPRELSLGEHCCSLCSKG